MSTNIVPFAPGAQTGIARPSWIDVMDRGVELAEIIANTDFVPKGLRGNQAAILAAILYGHEVGLEPMQSLSKIAVIDGKPTMAAEAQRALILAAGHELWPEDVTNTHATMVGRRRDSKQTVRVTWTLDDAKRARIAGKQNWQAYPRQMLIARATAELARQIFADVIGGMAATEEIEDVVDGDVPAPAVAVEPDKPTRRRRRPSSSPQAAKAAPEPEPQPEPEPPVNPDPPSELATRKLFALYRQKGLSERPVRLAHAEKVLGRPIGSASELSALDLDQLIKALEAEPDAELPEREREVLHDLESELGAHPVDEGGEERPPLPDDEP